ncbi:hypothetical protein ODV97_07820 [Enterococcus gallinarum]|nr:hypothetical protein [Enterococcus gallinarum]
MKTKSKEKVYAERQHSYKQEKEEIFKKALASVPKKTKNPPLKTNDDPYLPATFTLGCFVA